MYPLCAISNSSSEQISFAISKHTGKAALYNSTPFLDVVATPDKESTESHAESISNDKEDKLLLILESPEVFSASVIFFKSFSDSDESFFSKANSPSLATLIAAASSLSRLTVNNF